MARGKVCCGEGKENGREKMAMTGVALTQLIGLHISEDRQFQTTSLHPNAVILMREDFNPIACLAFRALQDMVANSIRLNRLVSHCDESILTMTPDTVYDSISRYVQNHFRYFVSQETSKELADALVNYHVERGVEPEPYDPPAVTEGLRLLLCAPDEDLHKLAADAVKKTLKRERKVQRAYELMENGTERDNIFAALPDSVEMKAAMRRLVKQNTVFAESKRRATASLCHQWLRSMSWPQWYTEQVPTRLEAHWTPILAEEMFTHACDIQSQRRRGIADLSGCLRSLKFYDQGGKVWLKGDWWLKIAKLSSKDKELALVPVREGAGAPATKSIHAAER